MLQILSKGGGGKESKYVSGGGKLKISRGFGCFLGFFLLDESWLNIQPRLMGILVL